MHVNRIDLKTIMITLLKPTKTDLPFIDRLWRDEATMKAVGGPVCLTKEKMEKWFERMVDPGSLTDRYFIVFYDKLPVGEASFHRFDPITKTGDLNIKVLAKHRGHGIAKRALEQLLKIYFTEFKAEAIFDPVAIRNLAGQRFLADFGFQLLKKDSEAAVFKLSKEKFLQKINN